jgi:hypothetical protein
MCRLSLYLKYFEWSQSCCFRYVNKFYVESVAAELSADAMLIFFNTENTLFATFTELLKISFRYGMDTLSFNRLLFTLNYYSL